MINDCLTQQWVHTINKTFTALSRNSVAVAAAEVMAAAVVVGGKGETMAFVP